MRAGLEFRVAGSGSTSGSCGVAQHDGELETRNWSPGARGFTLLELALALAIFGTLVAVLLTRLNDYQEAAEKAAMELTLQLVKTGLQLRLAELILANREAEAQRLEEEDPMRWLEEKPANYAGAYREPPERGRWYYDAGARDLVYVPATGSRLEAPRVAGVKQLRFRARLLRGRVRSAGGAVERVEGVRLAPAHPYRW